MEFHKTEYNIPRPIEIKSGMIIDTLIKNYIVNKSIFDEKFVVIEKESYINAFKRNWGRFKFYIRHEKYKDAFKISKMLFRRCLRLKAI